MYGGGNEPNGIAIDVEGYSNVSERSPYMIPKETRSVGLKYMYAAHWTIIVSGHRSAMVGVGVSHCWIILFSVN